MNFLLALTTTRRHHVYEVQTANTFPLGPTENIAEPPRLQYVTWAPNVPPAPATTTTSATTTTTTTTSTSTTMRAPANTTTNAARSGGAAATVTAVNASGGGSILLSSLAGAATGGGMGKPPLSNFQYPNGGAVKAFPQNQAIGFVYENDIYYKPKVQGELVCRITTTGERVGVRV